MRSLILSPDLNMCDMRKLRSFNHYTSKTVLDLLKTIYWKLYIHDDRNFIDRMLFYPYHNA